MTRLPHFVTRRLLQCALAGIVAVVPTTVPDHPAAAHPSSGARDEIVLSFGGDVHFEKHVAKQNAPGGLATLPGLFAGSDLVMVNLETALTTGGTAEPKKYRFRTAPSALQVLADAGVDVVSLANNHGMDYGRGQGLTDTLNARAHSPIPALGMGANTADAISPWRTTIKGQPIAVFAFVGLGLEGSGKATWPARADRAGMATWYDHRDAILAGVRAAQRRGDLIVTYVHWGTERQTCPNRQQRAIAAALIAAGADIVVGAHPHVLQGAGFQDGALVAYSLGNFVWYSGAGAPTAVLHVTIRGGKPVRYDLVPATWGRDGLPYALTGTKAAGVEATLVDRGRCAGLS